MSAKIDISPEQLDIVQAILRAHLPMGTRAWAFGSRVTWTAKPYSDLDLAVETAAPLPLEVMGDLQESFENSDLPWRVDVIDLKSVSPEFRAIVERQRIGLFRTNVGHASHFLSGGTPQKAKKDYWGKGYPWFSASNMKQKFLRTSDLNITEAGLRNGSRLAPSQSTLVLVRGSGLFNYVPICFADVDVAFNQDVKAVIAEDDVDPVYLHYTIESKRAFLDKNIGVTGIGAGKFDTRLLEELPFIDLLYSEQKRIGAIAEAFDRKIELNRQMNQTLEALARAVFEDWFVAFGPTRRKMAGETDPAAILGGLLPPDTAAPLTPLFPDQFGDNGLPLGWEGKTLGDVVEPRKGRNITKKTVTHGTVPVVAGGLSPAYYHDTANVTGPVITASASGANAGFVRLYNQDIWASDCSYISREQTDYLFTIYALLSSRQDEIYSMQQGAAQPHIYPSDLKRLAIADAPTPIWQACEELLSPMFEQLASNEKENQTLAATRDLLLPKLMSGELRLLDGGGGV